MKNYKDSRIGVGLGIGLGKRIWIRIRIRIKGLVGERGVDYPGFY